jgi:DNA-binding CsgD family transcriptional regulator
LSALPALTRSDAEQLLRLVGEAESLAGDQPFTGELLVELGRLIEADWVTYTEVDHVHRRSLVYLPRPGDEDDGSSEIPAEDWERMREHPVCERWRKDGRFYALRLSDAITQAELRRNRFYDQYFKPWGIEHELKVRLPSPPWHAQTFMFNRRRGRNFTKRDRLVLDLLTPHFTRLWQAARTRRILRAALTGLEQANGSDHNGVVLVNAAGGVEFASPAARRMLRHHFGDDTAARLRLPAELIAWISSSSKPMVSRLAGRELTVTRSAETLILRERKVAPALTAREREVLSWVARGKTNPEIAELLWLAPSTVRKHLENVYAKLGVATRTAAVTSFLGLIDAEAS